MRSTLKLYLHYVGISLRSQMEYRTSFLMMAIGQFLVTLVEFGAVWALFDRFKHINGWTLAQVGMLYGMANISFCLGEMFMRGFDMFHHMVKAGDFDRILLRPRSTVLQLMGQQFELSRLGRMAQGLLIMSWAISRLDVVWSPARAGLLLMAILGGWCLFAGLFVLRATLCFWTIEGLEILNTVIDGGKEVAQYPLSIYRPWFRMFFTLMVPLGCTTFFPSFAILGRAAPTGVPELFLWLCPLIGFAFLLACMQVWKVGVRHYCSTGS